MAKATVGINFIVVQGKDGLRDLTKDADGLRKAMTQTLEVSDKMQILICFNRPESAVLAYKKRREIETAFKAMKSSGFNIEDTHMSDMERIARLVAMVCMALVWAYLVGEHKDINIKPIRILKHGRKAKSLVKYGLEEISTILMRPTYTPKFDVFKFLSCT